MSTSYNHQKIQGNSTGTGAIPKGQLVSDSISAAVEEPSFFYLLSHLDKSDL